ncbi:MAG: glycosyltransferase family 2 protein [Planctomycetes bacterium]|nr:glycosyltransferase family 2 protein [Planctomycetota bacterium]
MISEQEKPIKYSVVIPVYNSEGIIGTTIDRIVAFFEKHELDYEVLLVNDGSRDGSWEVVREKAQANPHLVAMNLLHNYGQHTAVLCGLRKSTGDYVITLDDDMQNPPEEMIHLIEKAKEGYDLVVGKFRHKRHALYRRWGSIVVGAINRRIFHQPKDFTMTSFRLIRRDVVERICSYHTSYPYITGMALMFSANRANVMVDHRERDVGKSNYNVFKITELVMRILFNYSAVPLRLVSMMAFVVAALSFLLALFYFVRGLIIERSVPGWTSLIVLLSFFNAVTILILSMLGEYTVRLLNQTSAADVYHVKETIEHGD